MQKIYSFLVILIFLFSLSVGQEPIWKVYHSSINGIPSNNILTIIKDKHGSIWLGSGTSLVKWDGMYWKVCGNNYMKATAKDTMDNIWFVSNTFLYRIDENEQIIKVDSVNLLRDATGFAIDHNNNKWISSLNGLYFYNGVQLQLFDHNNSNLNTYNINDIFHKNGTIYLATSPYYIGDTNPMVFGGGVVKISGNNWQTLMTSSGLPSNNIRKITVDKDGVVWCSTVSELVSYDGQTWTTYTHINSPLPQTSIKVLVPDPIAGVWVGTADGLIHIHNNMWTLFNTNNSGLISNNIQSVFISNDSIFVATEKGLSIKTNTGWISYYKNNTAPPDGKIYTLSMNKDGELWVGGEGYILSKFNGINWIPFHVGVVRSINYDKNDNMWITTTDYYEGGIQIYNGNEWQVFNMLNSGFDTEHVYDLAFDSQGNKWFATYPRWEGVNLVGGGLVKYDGNSWEIFNTDNSDLPTNKLTAIAIDSNDIKWIGTDGEGLIKIDSNQYTVYKQNDSGISYNHIYCLELDRHGKLWIGTGYGLSVFDGENWEVFTTHNSPIPADYVWSIAFEDDNTAWIAATFGYPSDIGGLTKFDGKNWKIFTHQNSGIPHEQNRVYSVIVDQDSNKWIGMEHGYLAMLDENELPDDEPDPDPDPEVPESIYLLENYPNPFNKNTKIKYNIAEDSFVNIIVFDISGKKIANLVNANKVKGYDEIDFEATHLSSGVYPVVLKANNKIVKTHKLVYIK